MILDGFGYMSDIRTVTGSINSDGVILFSIVKNEKFFIESFLNHYRSIGVSQFVILDDKSDDGTFEYLCDQKDVMVLGSEHNFGDKFFRFEGFHLKKRRRGTAWKISIPKHYCGNRWAIYADADEFLLLPSGFGGIEALCRFADSKNITAIPASLFELYPESIFDLETHISPRCLSDMIDAYPFFDAAPITEWVSGEKKGRKLGHSVTERLFAQYNIGEEKKLNNANAIYAPQRVNIRNSGGIHKVPLVYWKDNYKYTGSHGINTIPTNHILLSLCHFKFTFDLRRKIDEAIATKAYAGGSTKYIGYKTLFEKMKAGDGSFLSDSSQKYEGVEQLIDCKLMKFDF